MSNEETSTALKERARIFNWINQNGHADLYSLRIEGIHIWPLLKTRAFLKLISGKRVKAEKASFWSKVQRIAISGMRLKGDSDKRTVLFAGNRNHLTLAGNEFSNRYFDPLMDALEEEGIPTEMLETGSNLESPRYRKDRIISLSYRWWRIPFRLYKRRQVLQKLKRNKAIVHFDLAYSKAFGLPELALIRDLSNAFVQAYAWYEVGCEFFRKNSISDVFLLCYYSSPFYGLVAAANECNVRAWDFQHGSQGATHIAYNPKEGEVQSPLNTVPKGFWVWDAFTYKNLVEKFSDVQPEYRVVLGGNPDMEGEGPNKSIDGKPTILFTMQPFSFAIESFVVEAIAESCEKYNWVLKEHPRTSKNIHERLIEILSSAEILDKVTIVSSTEQSLGHWLQNAQIHMSYSSGSIVEATLKQIPSIVLDENGLSQVEESDLIYSCLEHTPSNLLKVVNSINLESHREQVRDLPLSRPTMVSLVKN